MPLVASPIEQLLLLLEAHDPLHRPLSNSQRLNQGSHQAQSNAEPDGHHDSLKYLKQGAGHLLIAAVHATTPRGWMLKYQQNRAGRSEDVQGKTLVR